MRLCPTDGNDYEFASFCDWADDQGIGQDVEQWLPWWECWRTAIRCSRVGVKS